MTGLQEDMLDGFHHGEVLKALTGDGDEERATIGELGLDLHARLGLVRHLDGDRRHGGGGGGRLAATGSGSPDGELGKSDLGRTPNVNFAEL